MRFGTAAIALLAAALAAAGTALPAAAKEGARATITSRVPVHAAAGSSFTLRWIVTVPGGSGRRQPFVADGMFVRLIGAPGVRPRMVFAHGDHGRYRALVRVPRGGLRGVELGLRGWATDARGTRPSDGLFPITNDPFRTRDSPSR